jgi:hypothetical protein
MVMVSGAPRLDGVMHLYRRGIQRNITVESNAFGQLDNGKFW